MSFGDDLKFEASRIFREQWNVREGRVVPDLANIAQRKNEAVHFDRATFLYADLSGSTKMVDERNWEFAGEVYRAYLYVAARVIRSMEGEIVAYDGDRIMCVFLGDLQSTSAAKTGLKINYAIHEIINPAIRANYPKSTFLVRQVVGIDCGEVRVAQAGVRGDSDLVWVGSAANYAAKLTELTADYPTWITETAYKRLADDAKLSSNGENMWEPRIWKTMGDMRIYRSNWMWTVR